MVFDSTPSLREMTLSKSYLRMRKAIGMIMLQSLHQNDLPSTYQLLLLMGSMSLLPIQKCPRGTFMYTEMSPAYTEMSPG